MRRLATRGVSPCTGKISGKFAATTRRLATENVACPVKQVNSGNYCLNIATSSRVSQPDRETVKAGFFPLIGQELADFWEEIINETYFSQHLN
jgi:hypothetical protein